MRFRGYYYYEAIHQMLCFYEDWEEVLFQYNSQFSQNIKIRTFKQSYNRWINKHRYQTNNYLAKDFVEFSQDKIYLAEVVG